MQRNSEKTRQKILYGLEQLITRKGFTEVGVNAVAREAGVDKVLIYRYFGSMEGLLEAFSVSMDICPKIGEVLDNMPDGAAPHEIVTDIILEHAFALQKSPLAQEVVCWELTEQNPLTKAFAANMEQKAMKALEDRGIIPSEDLITLSAVLVSGLQYLILRGRNKNPMMNIDYSKPSSRKKVEQVIAAMMKAYFESEAGSV